MLFPKPVLLTAPGEGADFVDCPFEALSGAFVCGTALAVVEGNASGMLDDGCSSSRALAAELGRLLSVAGGN